MLQESGEGERGYFFNISVKDTSLEICELLACVDFAKITEVVKAHQVPAAFSHGFDVKPTFPVLDVGPATGDASAVCSGRIKPNRARYGSERGVREKVLVASLLAREACGEIRRRIRTPCKYTYIGGKNTIKELDIGELVCYGVERGFVVRRLGMRLLCGFFNHWFAFF